MDDAPRLPARLRDRVLARLGLTGPPPTDHDGLRSLYRAWSAAVPFDNLRKMIALRAGDGRALPGIEPEDFLSTWLEHGTGGTCWPGSNALHALVCSLGFDAVRITGHMRDMGVVNHGSVIVTVRSSGAEERVLVDSSMLTNDPLPLGAGIYVRGDPVFEVEVEAEDGTHVVWWDAPPNSSFLPCRLVPGAAGHAEYVAAYERSRERSAFNDRLYARRNLPGEMVVLLGNTRFRKSAAGLEKQDLSPDELESALREEFGYSPDIVQQWIRSGALEASFVPPAGPKPPPITRPRPSQRTAV